MDPLLERDRELDAVARTLDHAREGAGAALLIEGEAGIGKSTLLAVAARRAQDAGMRVLRGHGSPLEEGVAYGVARGLLLPPLLDAPDPDVLLRGAAGLARDVLLAGADAGADATRSDDDALDAAPPSPGAAAFAVRHGMTWLVAALADEGGPLAILVDDLQFADPPSIRFLRALAGRAPELPVALLLAARPAAGWSEPEAARALAGEVERVRPRRLSRSAVGAALADRLGVTPTPAFTAAAAAESDGIPYLVVALAAALSRASIAPDDEHAGSLGALAHAEVAEDVAARLHVLSADARVLAHAVAILGDRRPASEIARVARLDPAAADLAAGALETAGLVRGWPLPAFDHSLVRSAVLDEVGVAERADLHARAAEVALAAGESERAAVHLAQTPGRGDPRRVAVLAEVGRRALTRGAPDVAVGHLRRALEEPPPDADRADTLFELGLAELALGDPAAPDRLLAAGRAFSDPDARLRALMTSGISLSYLGRWSDAFERMRAAIAESEGADRTALVIARTELAAFLLSSIGTGRLAARQLDGLDREVPRDLAVRVWVDGAIALRDASAGLPRDEVLARLRSALGPRPPGPGSEPLEGLPIIALVLIDAFEQADGILERIVAQGRRRGDLTLVRILSAWQALGRARQGRLREAEETALAVGESDDDTVPAIARVVAAIARGGVALDRGDLDAAAACVAPTFEHDPRVAELNFCDSYLVTRGRVRMAEGDVATAYDLFLTAGRRQTTWGGASPSVAQWQLYGARAAAALGRTEEAHELIDREVAAAERLGAPRPLSMALRARAALGGDDVAGRTLRDALDVVEGERIDLERARVLAQLGDLELRAGRAERGREALRPALDLAWRSGADELAEQIRAALARAGARPGRRERGGVTALTPAEARTARMAASGLTNRELAETLFVTEKTVETHLTATYRKLNIDGRRQLSAALGEDAGEADDADALAAG